MRTLTSSESLIIIMVVAAMTFFIRLLPFLIAGKMNRSAAIWQSISLMLPTAILGVLLIYAIRTIEFANLHGFMPQILGVAIVMLLHRWKRNTLISIGVGTICYMLMVQFILPA